MKIYWVGLFLCSAALAQSERKESVWEKLCVKPQDTPEFLFKLTKPRDAECDVYKEIHDGEIIKQQRQIELAEWRKKEAERRLFEGEQEKLKQENLTKLAEEKRIETEIAKQKAEEDKKIREQAYAEKRRLEKEAAQKRSDEIKAEMVREEREYQREKRVAIDAENAKKERCQNDYKNPSIGMTQARFEICIGKLRPTGQLNRKDGAVVSSYRSGAYTVTTIDGRIVAWDKY